MNVGQNMLPMFLKTAESLQVRGLTENNTLNPKVSLVLYVIIILLKIEWRFHNWKIPNLMHKIFKNIEL